MNTIRMLVIGFFSYGAIFPLKYSLKYKETHQQQQQTYTKLKKTAKSVFLIWHCVYDETNSTDKENAWI